MGSKIGEVYVEIGARVDKLKKDMKDVQTETENSVKKMEEAYKSAKLDIDTKLAQMKMSEVLGLHSKLKAELNEKIKLDADFGSIQNVQTSINILDETLKGLNTELEKTKNKGGDALDSLAKVSMIVSGLNQTRELLTSITSKFQEMVMRGAELEVLKANFKGTVQDLNNFRAAVAGTVSTGSLIKLSNQATDLGLSLKQQVIAFSLAKDAGEKYGVSTEEGFSRLVMATEGNVRALRSLGIQKAFYNEKVKELAASHGGEMNNLDAETQKQIRIQAILESSNISYEEATRRIANNKDILEQLGVKIKSCETQFGQLIEHALMPLIQTLVDSGDAGKYLVGGLSLIGGTIVPIIPSLIQLTNIQKLLKIETLAAASAMNTEAAAAGTAAAATKGFLASLSVIVAIGATLGVGAGMLFDHFRDEHEKALNDQTVFNSNMKEKQKELHDILGGDKRYVPGQGTFTITTKEKDIQTVKKLKEANGELQKQLENTDVTDKKTIDTINKKIKANQTLIDKITGVNKAEKDAAKEKEQLYKNLVNGLGELSGIRLNAEQKNLEKEVAAFRKAKLDEAAIDEYYTNKSIDLAVKRFNAIYLRNELAARSGITPLIWRMQKQGLSDDKINEAIAKEAIKYIQPKLPSAIPDWKHAEMQGIDPEKVRNAKSQTEADKKDDENETWKKSNKQLADLGLTIAGLGNSFDSVISDMIIKGQSFTESFSSAITSMADQVISQLTRIGIQFAMLSAAQSIFSGPLGAAGTFGGFLIHALGGNRIEAPVIPQSVPGITNITQQLSIQQKQSQSVGKAADYSRLEAKLDGVVGSIQAMNVNLMKKNWSPKIINQINMRDLVRAAGGVEEELRGNGEKF